jgi:aminopeptidase-like protein
MRTPPGEFDVNHTSADDMEFVSPPALGESARTCLEILAVVDGDRFLKSANPYGEPQLGRRGLFRAAGGVGARDQGLPDERALLWVLSLADGVHSLLDITRRSGMEFATIRSAADALERVGLVAEGSLQ